jgi:hypothetical protein
MNKISSEVFKDSRRWLGTGNRPRKHPSRIVLILDA